METEIDEAVVSKVLALKPTCRRLNLSSNGFVRVRHLDTFAPLTQLTTLDLSNNALRELGKEFRSLVALRLLNASNNRISRIDGLSSCLALNKLDISSNELADPEALVHLQPLSHLQHLRLENNTICGVLAAIPEASMRESTPEQRYQAMIRAILPQVSVLDEPVEANTFSSAASVMTDSLSVAQSHRSIVVMQHGVSPTVQHTEKRTQHRPSPHHTKLETLEEASGPLSPSRPDSVRADSPSYYTPEKQITRSPFTEQVSDVGLSQDITLPESLFMVSPASPPCARRAAVSGSPKPQTNLSTPQSLSPCSASPASSANASHLSPGSVARPLALEEREVLATASQPQSLVGSASEDRAGGDRGIWQEVSHDVTASGEESEGSSSYCSSSSHETRMRRNKRLVRVPQKEFDQLVADRDKYYLQAQTVEQRAKRQVSTLKRQLDDAAQTRVILERQWQTENDSLRLQKEGLHNLVQKLQHDLQVAIHTSRDETAAALAAERAAALRTEGELAASAQALAVAQQHTQHLQKSHAHISTKVRDDVQAGAVEVFRMCDALSHVVLQATAGQTAKLQALSSSVASLSSLTVAYRARFDALRQSLTKERALWAAALSARTRHAKEMTELELKAAAAAAFQTAANSANSKTRLHEDSSSDDEDAAWVANTQTPAYKWMQKRSPAPLHSAEPGKVDIQSREDLLHSHMEELNHLAASLSEAITATDSTVAPEKPMTSRSGTARIPPPHSLEASIALMPSNDCRNYLLRSLQENMRLQEAITALHDMLPNLKEHSAKSFEHEVDALRERCARTEDLHSAATEELRGLRKRVEELLIECNEGKATREAAHVRQLTAAREASLRARAQAANLEAQLEVCRSETSTLKAELQRAQRELSQQLDVKQEEFNRLSRDYNQKIQGLRVEIANVKRERDILLQALHPSGVSLHGEDEVPVSTRTAPKHAHSDAEE